MVTKLRDGDMEVTCRIHIDETNEDFVFKGIRTYDSLKNPPHRLEVYDGLGNAVFVMLRKVVEE